jgi:hypothetical protein
VPLNGTASLTLISSSKSSTFSSIDRPLAAQESKKRNPRSRRKYRQEERQSLPAPPNDKGASKYTSKMQHKI